MTLELSHDEFIRLIKVLYAADVVLHDLREDDFPSTRALIQKFYERAVHEGLTHFIHPDKETGLFRPTRELEDEVEPILQEYLDDTFWYQLESSLADRDMKEELGADTVEQMELNAYLDTQETFASRYAESFTNNRVNDLYLRENDDESDEDDE